MEVPFDSRASFVIGRDEINVGPCNFKVPSVTKACNLKELDPSTSAAASSEGESS